MRNLHFLFFNLSGIKYVKYTILLIFVEKLYLQGYINACDIEYKNNITIPV